MKWNKWIKIELKYYIQYIKINDKINDIKLMI
jgi:hypothetical protein